MTDEQLGRAWFAKHGGRPVEGKPIWDGGPVYWYWQWALPTAATGYCGSSYPSEADAYAAVGAALRQVVRFAQDVWDLQAGVTR